MLNLKIALRFIFKKPIQYLFIIFVVTIGVAIFYFVFNAADGLKTLVINTTSGSNSYISAKGNFEFNSYEEETTKNFRNEAFNNDSRIRQISYSLSVPAEINRLWLPLNETILMKGLDFNEGGQIQSIKSRITFNKKNNIPKTLNNDDTFFGEIAIGNRLMIKLGYKDLEQALNKPLYITFIVSNDEVVTLVFKIVAVYHTDLLELSEKSAFTTIETLHKIDAFKGRANQIEISTNNPLNSDDVSFKLNDILNKYYTNYTLTNWQDGNKYIVNALYIEDVSLLLIQIFTAVAISFGLSSIITFIVKDKSKQIGILKALGINNKRITKIFLYQVLILLIIGTLIGLFLGNELGLLFMKIFKRPNLNAPLVRLKVGLNNSFTTYTIIVIFISSILAALIPLRTANRLKIIEIIKGE